jgi:transcriptional regulator with XRE-family HTH domain
MDAKTFKDIRRKTGLYQSEVAEILGVDKQTISRWETRSNRIPRSVEFAFYSLTDDMARINAIKALRKPRIHGRPFTKRGE